MSRDYRDEIKAASGKLRGKLARKLKAKRKRPFAGALWDRREAEQQAIRRASSAHHTSKPWSGRN